MAVTRRSLGDWEYVLTEPEKSTRSPRRSRKSSQQSGDGGVSSLLLKRKSDNLQLSPGDHILYEEPEEEESDDYSQNGMNKGLQVGLVLNIEFGTDNFIDLQVLWFDKPQELQIEDKSLLEIAPQELFLTPLNQSVLAKHIIGKTNVLDSFSFDKLAKAKKANAYFCKRAVDENSVNLTDTFNYTETIMKCLRTRGFKGLIDFIRTETSNSKVSSGKSVKSPITPSSVEPEKQLKLDSKNEPEQDNTQDNDPNEPEIVEISDESSSEANPDSSSDDIITDSDSDLEFENKPKRRKVAKSTRSTRRPVAKTKGKLKEEAPKTPTKSPRTKKNNSPATPTSTPKKNDNEYSASLDFIKKIMGKKKITIKDKLNIPSFATISPKKRKQPDEDYELLDTTSRAFKDLKQKLHASTKLNSLPCREDEFTSLYLNIENSIREETGCCLYVSGTPGIGKTATIREVMNQMKELKSLGEIGEFNYFEINGLKLINPNYAYTELWSKISGIEVLNANTANLLDAYFKEPSESKKPTVVMIDELDQIATKKQSVMYNLFNWPTYSESKLIVIAVANTMDLPERVLSNKISSRLGLKRIQFIGYTFEQLGYIIEHRLDLLTRQAKHNVIIDKDAISFASRKVASVSGDARRALQICRRAVEIAELEYRVSLQQQDSERPQSFHVKIPHIAKAINETINSPIAKYVSTLSFTSKLLLTAVLLRMKRSGVSENPLGDVIDEMKILLTMATSKHLIFDKHLDPPLDMSEVLLNNKLLPFNGSSATPGDSIRVENFRFVFHELVENGLISMQNIKSERYKLVSLNVSQEEVLSTLKKDPLVANLL